MSSKLERLVAKEQGSSAQSFFDLVNQAVLRAKHFLEEQERETLQAEEVLNNEAISPTSSTYHQVVERYDSATPIWSYLRTPESKIRFLTYLLSHDPVVFGQEYIYGIDDPKFKEKNPKIKIDVEKPFVCRHFARKMYYAYRTQDPPQQNQSDEQYTIVRVPAKFHVPIKEVEITFPFPIKPNPPHEERPHAINAVHLGGNVRKYFNWFFFEPQGGASLFRTASYPWKQIGNIFTIYPDHSIALDKDTARPLDIEKAVEDETVVKFAINKDKKIVSVQATGDVKLTKAVYQIDYKTLASLYSTFEKKGKALTAILTSGNFSKEDILAL